MEIGTDTKKKTLDRHSLEQIVTLSSEGVLLLDARDPCMPVVYVNPAFEALTGYSASEVVGSAWPLLTREGGETPGLDELQSALARSEAIDLELPDLRKDGVVWMSSVSFSPLRDVGGDIRYFLIQQRESAERTEHGFNVEVGLLRRELGRARQKIDHMNRVDQATGLLRYDAFVELLGRDLAVSRREGRPVTLMAFEIIELDVYRGTFGSKAADSCVRMIGAQISGTLRRAGDLCARYSDSLLVASVLGQEDVQAAALAERIVSNVRGLKLHNPRAKSGRYVSVASGVAGGVPHPDDDVDRLIERAKRELEAPRGAAGVKSYA